MKNHLFDLATLAALLLSTLLTILLSRLFNPLSPHDALKHHFTSLKTDLIYL